MGYTNSRVIESGAKYLLSLLLHKSPIRYSTFYDGTDETSRRLEDAIGLDFESRGWYCAAHVMDLAVYELGEQGVVETKFLDDKLRDGEPDYEIYLTERGKQACAKNEKLRFWDAE